MNPLIFIVALPLAFMVWVLVISLRAGEFNYRNAKVKRSDSPGVFWTLFAFHLGIILYVVSLAIQLE